MILANTADLKKYISVAQNFDFASFSLYITKAINGYTKKYVGELHTFLADADSDDDSVKTQAREHLRSAIANFGYFLFTPYNSITMDSSGMANVQNDQRKNIEWWQLNDIRRELLRSGHESMDLLLAILEANPDIFEDWTAQFGTKNKELLIHNTFEFQKAYNINDSRQTFLALVPAIRMVEDQYINNFLSAELLTALKTTEVEGNLLKLKEYAQKAVVAFTIAKVYDEGIFNLDASGIKLKFDTLPNEKVQAVDYGKQVEQLNHAIKKQLDNGTNYMNLVKQIITDNPDDFSDYENPLKNTTPTAYVAYNTQGVVGL